jgi:heat shock protein HspQ
MVPVSAKIPTARYGIGEMVRHRLLDFRGVIFDVDRICQHGRMV